jgi:hypothetical protein
MNENAIRSININKYDLELRIFANTTTPFISNEKLDCRPR